MGAGNSKNKQSVNSVTVINWHRRLRMRNVQNANSVTAAMSGGLALINCHRRKRNVQNANSVTAAMSGGLAIINCHRRIYK